MRGPVHECGRLLPEIYGERRLTANAVQQEAQPHRQSRHKGLSQADTYLLACTNPRCLLTID